ncbi:MAG: M24 family metallopeptidase, partial [Gammaproteobacteria bacterium]
MKESRRRFDKSEYEQRQHKTRAAMDKAGVDLLIVYDPANMCWLTGYDGWSFYVHQCVVISTGGALFWYGRGIDAKGGELTTDLPFEDILSYPDDYVMSPDRHPMEFLANILKEKGLDKQRIGLEKDNYYFSARAAESLYQCLPEARFSDQTGLVNWQRAVKSATELTYMRRAGKVIEGVYQRVMEVAKPGMRKNELVAEILHAGAMGNDGHYGDYTSFVPLIGAGDEAAACHMTWDDKKLDNNEGMFLELAGAYARYHCPCSRTLFLGTPPQKYIDIEKVIGECIENALEMFKPGVVCEEISDNFTKTLKKYGYEKNNRVGYPIGLSYPPDWGERTMSLRSSDTTVLEENMTFHFMPAIWFDDWGFEMTESVRVCQN